MSQSKRASRVEVALGTIIGYLVALITQMLVFPLWGIETTAIDNFSIAAIFTVISLIRGYYVRRFFNQLHIKGILK